MSKAGNEKRKAQRAENYARHLCTYCGAQDAWTLGGGHLCKKCRDYFAVNKRERYKTDEAYRRGMIEYAKANRNHERENARRKERYRARREAKRCPACNKQDERTLSGKTYCAVCAMNARDRTRKTDFVKREREKDAERMRTAHIARGERYNYGLCYVCGNPLDGQMCAWEPRESKLCRKCYKRALEHISALAKENIGAGKYGTHKFCPNCGAKMDTKMP